ncbi:MAG: sugar ABC transporter permease [Chloroflexi bacterium]|nr:sugar ABC transporter permease [Chloroflexota bacterium]
MRTGASPRMTLPNVGLLNPLHGSRRVKVWLALPAFVFIIAGIIYPSGYLLYNSMTAWSLTRLDLGQTFIGLDNYAKLLADQRFYSSLSITATFTIATTSIQTVLGVSLALLLNRNIRGEGLVRTLLLIPWLTAPFISGFNFRFMMAPNIGVIAQVLEFLGFDAITQASILGSPKSALGAIILVHVWNGVPGTMLVVTGGLKTIPEELYLAARVDGADRWQLLRYITLPLVRYAVLISAFLTTLFIFKAFEMIFIMTGGGPGDSTEVLAVYQYWVGIRTLNIGYGSSIAVVQLVVAFIVSIIYARLMFSQAD